MAKREVLFVGSKTFLKKNYKELLKDKRFKLSILRKTDKNYEIDKKKGKYVIVKTK